MAKRKKKNAVTLILLLFALAGLIGSYLWYTNREPASEKEAENGAIALSTIETEKINSLHYIYEDTDLTFIKEGDVWIAQEDRNRPINQARVKNMIGVIDDISATRVIAEKAEKLEDYGLKDPVSFLQAVLSDGTKVTLQIGNRAVTGEGYYALVNEDSKVYLLPVSYGSGLKFNQTEMTEVAEGPAIEAGNIRRISVNNRDTEDLELVYKEDNGLDISGSTMFPWYLVKPYTQEYTADSDEVATLREKYTSIDYIKCVDYNPGDLSKYGLDNPVSVVELNYLETRKEKLDKPEKDPDTGEEIKEKTYYDPKQYKFSVGGLDENNNYYILIDGDTAVYTMDKDTVDAMIKVDAFSVMNKFVAIPNIDMVDRIEIEIEGVQYTISLKRTTGKNEAGEEEVTTTYFYNGNEVKERSFKEFYQIIIGAKYDAPIKGEVNEKGRTPYLTITYHLNDEKGTVLTTSYLPYDESFYIIKNIETRFFADKRKIDDIVKAVIELGTTE